MQERWDADVGEIENSGEEQECRKKTKKEREVKAMTKTQWLKTTYTHTWRNGGKNSGYVRSATPDLKIVARKGA